MLGDSKHLDIFLFYGQNKPIIWTPWPTVLSSKGIEAKDDKLHLKPPLDSEYYSDFQTKVYMTTKPLFHLVNHISCPDRKEKKKSYFLVLHSRFLTLCSTGITMKNHLQNIYIFYLNCPNSSSLPLDDVGINVYFPLFLTLYLYIHTYFYILVLYILYKIYIFKL